jgi:hypothetical protein
VDGAGATDDQQTVIALLDDLNGLLAAGIDCFLGSFGLWRGMSDCIRRLSISRIGRKTKRKRR